MVPILGEIPSVLSEIRHLCFLLSPMGSTATVCWAFSNTWHQKLENMYPNFFTLHVGKMAYEVNSDVYIFALYVEQDAPWCGSTNDFRYMLEDDGDRTVEGNGSEDEKLEHRHQSSAHDRYWYVHPSHKRTACDLWYCYVSLYDMGEQDYDQPANSVLRRWKGSSTYSNYARGLWTSGQPATCHRATFTQNNRKSDKNTMQKELDQLRAELDSLRRREYDLVQELIDVRAAAEIQSKKIDNIVKTQFRFCPGLSTREVPPAAAPTLLAMKHVHHLQLYRAQQRAGELQELQSNEGVQPAALLHRLLRDFDDSIFLCSETASWW
ncbi:hypothetical protein EV401DRAFT_2199122, partial [Pisolithus croceorrhizus]